MEPAKTIPPLEDFNAWADFIYYQIGVNPIPADTRNKRTFTKWSRWQVQSLPQEKLEEWKQTNTFASGIAIVVGKVWRGKHAGKYLTFIDLDNLAAIQEFCTRDGRTVSLKEIAQRFIIEQHLDDTNKAHVYFYSEIPFRNKSSDVKSVLDNPHQVDTSAIPAFEVKGQGAHGIAYFTPSMHKNGHRYQIIGTAEPITLNPSEAHGMMQHLDAICKKHGLQYLENGNGSSSGSSQVPIRDLFRDDFVIYEGHNRHLALLRAMESLIKRTVGILSLEEIKELSYKWNQEHCKPPLDEHEFKRQWKDATKFIIPTLQEHNFQAQEPQRVIEFTEELTKEISWDDVAHVLESSVKKDWPSKVITFNAMLLAQTNDDQFNVGYQAESAAGKSYIAIEIAKYFPQDEVIMIASASPTAFFHDSGKWDPDKKALVVDLKHKILIFLDMQGFQLLEKLRPILSHDKEELHYKITDKSQKHGLRTKNVIIRGPPTVIFCSTKMDPDEQEKTRMLLLSPSTDQEKLKESIEFAALSKSDREAYQKRLAQDSNRNRLIDRIIALRQLGVREVIIPYEGKTVCDRFLAERKDHLLARHQRDFPRIFSFIKSHALLNAFYREKPVGKEHHTILANEQDIEAGFILYKKIEESNELGLSPFVYRIYKEVIERQLDPAMGLNRKQIRSKFYSVFHKTLTTKFEDSVLMQLESAGLITQELDPNDKRKLLIYPTHPEDIF